MKKLYTLAAVAALAFSANAQLYICGNGEGLGWAPEAPMEVQAVDGKYTVTINNLVQFKMSTAKGDWDTFNAAALSCIPSKETLGQAMPLTQVEGDMYTPWKGNYTLVVPADLSTLTLTTNTPEPTGAKNVYLRGTMNGWLNDADDAMKAEWKFAPVEGEANTYTFSCAAPHNLPVGTSFKIADLDWADVNYGAGGAVFPDEFGGEWNYNASDATMGADFEGVITIVLPTEARGAAYVTLNPESAGVGNVAVDNNEPKEYFNLQGVRVENPANGLFIVRQGDKVSKVLVK